MLKDMGFNVEEDNRAGLQQVMMQIGQNGKLDKTPCGPGSKKLKVLNNVTKELGLLDVWRDKNERNYLYMKTTYSINSIKKCNYK